MDKRIELDNIKPEELFKGSLYIFHGAEWEYVVRARMDNGGTYIYTFHNYTLGPRSMWYSYLYKEWNRY